MQWSPTGSEPSLSLVQQLPISFMEGFSPFSASYSNTKIIVDATGIRYGNGALLPSSDRRVSGWEMEASSTAQQVVFPDPLDRNIVYYASAPELTGSSAWGGIQEYHLFRIDLTSGVVTEPFGGVYFRRADFFVNGLQSTECVAAASFERHRCVWIVTPLRKPNGPTPDDDSVYLYAYRLTSQALEEPVMSAFKANLSVAAKMTFSPSGRLAYLADNVLAFEPTTGQFQMVKRLDSTGDKGNRIQNGLFSPSERYLWIPRQWWSNDEQRYYDELLQYDLHDMNDTIQPIYRKPLTHEQWWAPLWTYTAAAMGPDCRLYFSNQQYISRVEYPDLRGADAKFNPTWRAAPSTFRNDGNTYCGLPDLVNQLTFPQNQRSCLWPRAEIKGDTICEGSCAQVTSTYYNEIDLWSWTFEGGIPATYIGKSPPCVRYQNAGVYRAVLIATNTTGSDTIDAVVIVRPSPHVSAGNDLSICKGGTAILNASGAKTYRWQPGSGLSDTTASSPTVMPTEDSVQYVVTGTDEFGCVGRDTIVVRQGALKAEITADTAICIGSSVTIEARGGAEFRWWSSGEPLSASGSSIVVSPSIRTTYTVEVRSGMCFDTVSVNVDVHDTPTLSIRGDTLICSGNQATLLATADQDGDVRWYEGGDFINTGRSVVVSPTKSTTYVAMFTNLHGCQDTQSITVRVEKSIEIVDVDTLICRGSSIILNGTEHVIENDTSWLVVATTTSGCADTSFITIRTETIDLNADGAIVCEGEEATCRAFASDSNAVYTWFDEDGVFLYTGPVFTSKPTATHRAIVRAVSPLGCSATDTVDLTIRGREQLTLRLGNAHGRPGSTVATLLQSDLMQFPSRLYIEPTSPEAVLTSATNGIVVNDGHDGGPVIIDLLSKDAMLTWQLYLGVRKTIPLIGKLPFEDNTCSNMTLLNGHLEIEGCAITLRTVTLGMAVSASLFSLQGEYICNVDETTLDAVMNSLPIGMYLLRSNNLNIDAEKLVKIE